MVEVWRNLGIVVYVGLLTLLTQVKESFREHLIVRDERGQMLEYVLLALLIAVALIVAITLFSGALQNAFNRLTNAVNRS